MALKILSVDDDPSITKLLSILLGSYGMKVIVANSGTQGVEMARNESPDLILLDIMMPDMNGLEVCQAIRTFSDVPILAFSALGGRDQVAKAMEAGFNGFLEKPASGDVLVAHITKLTEGRG